MKKKLKELQERLIKGGWGEMEKPNYPRPQVGDWLQITHPEVLQEYKEGFDINVRETKNEA